MEGPPHTKEKLIIDFLNKVSISCDTLDNLDGRHIQRSLLLDVKLYESVKEYIPKLRSIFSTSYLTSLQKTAEDNQKWPLLNLVRQLLKSCNYHLVPKRLCDGYTKDGKKKYKRIFLIERLRSTQIITHNIS